MALETGRRVGQYEILGALGTGGMGDVYRALDGLLGREVAIKVLPDVFAAHPDRLARFEREARLLASLSHPNIAVVHGLVHTDGLHFLHMELVRGETLAQRIARGPSSLAEVLLVGSQIAAALEAAHAQSIVHRDLKPANVMITTLGVVKILDFGLAKIVTDVDSTPGTQAPTIGSEPTLAGVVMGTTPYMSPEQARGDTVDRRTDIWAFGCVLYELLTGARAFGGRTASDTIAAVLREDPDWSRLAAVAPPQILSLVRRCMHKDPHLRLHDIADARIEIEEIQRGATDSQLSVLPSAAPAIVRRPVHPWRLAAITVVGALAAGAAGFLAAYLTRLPADRSVTRATVALPADTILDVGRSAPIAISPDGRVVAYTAVLGRGQTQLFVRRLDEIDGRPIPSTEGATTPFFSSEGRWIGYYAGGALRRVSLSGGVPLTLAETPPVWSAAWDGNRIVFASSLAGSGLSMISADGGDIETLTTPAAGEVQHGYPQVLPGGTHVLFSIFSNGAWRPAVLSVADRTWRMLGNGRPIGEGARFIPTGHIVYAQAGGLVAVPFRWPGGDIEGEAVPLLERAASGAAGGPSFAIAPDNGTLLYVPPDPQPRTGALVRLGRDGQSAPMVEARLSYLDPALSPDGRRIAVTIASGAGSDVWVIDLERDTRTRFTTGDVSALPIWSGDGTRLAFQSYEAGIWSLFWQAVDGTGARQPFVAPVDRSAAIATDTSALLPGTLPTLSGLNPVFPTSWNGPSDALAFHERKPGGEHDIWVAEPGGEALPFLITPYDERAPKFSPDRRWLAYVSNESGRDEVYVQPFPGPGRKWVISSDGGSDPVWDRAGRELYYRQNDWLMAVPVRLGADFSAGRTRRLIETRFDTSANGPNFDVSPDGQWFVAPRLDGRSMSSSLHLVLNWFAFVTAKTSEARP